MGKSLAQNRKARFDYEILEKFEAGISLKGYEVKAIKAGKISLKGSFVSINKNEEIFLKNAHLTLLKESRVTDYIENSDRKLLLHKKEITKLADKIKQSGLTIVPLSIYLKRRLIKMEIALARGKAKYDKRKVIKDRDEKRRVDRMIKAV